MFEFVWPFIFGIIFMVIMYSIEAHKGAVVQLIVIPLIIFLLGLKSLVYFWPVMAAWMCVLSISALITFFFSWLFIYFFACYGTH